MWIPIEMTTSWQTKDYFTTKLIVNGGHENTYVLSSKPICPGQHWGHYLTLPETNKSPLKMDGWKTTFLLGRPIFRGYVSFRECILVFFWTTTSLNGLLVSKVRFS